MRFTYSSTTTHVYKEEEAYSLLSLVADCGGTLGLFIGFNFLMFWDWMIVALRILPFHRILNPKYFRNKSLSLKH